MEPPESVGMVRDPAGYPPEYVCDAAMGKAMVSSFFSLEIEHNGIFCGPSSKLEYVSPTVEILDYCSAANFSYSFIEEHLKWLSYPVEEHNIYWCRTGCVMSDGLVRIRGDADVQHMIRASGEHKVLVIIIDHSDFIQVFRNDVIYEMHSSVPMSPTVPRPSNRPRSRDEITSANQQIEIGNVSEKAHQVTGEVIDSDFSDSDFSIDEGDDDLFDENIDFDVEEDEPEEVDVEPEYVLEDQDLELSREEEKLKYKFSAFNAKVDMESPIFKVGMVFADVKELRKALIAYSIKNRVQVHKVKNETKRLDAVCKPGCPWLLKAGKDNRTGGFVIKSYAGVHKCQKAWQLKALTANFLTSFFIDEFRDDQKIFRCREGQRKIYG